MLWVQDFCPSIIALMFPGCARLSLARVAHLVSVSWVVMTVSLSLSSDNWLVRLFIYWHRSLFSLLSLSTSFSLLSLSTSLSGGSSFFVFYSWWHGPLRCYAFMAFLCWCRSHLVCLMHSYFCCLGLSSH